MKKIIGYFPGTHGDLGGASRVVFNIIRKIDKQKFNPIIFLPTKGNICKELERRDIKYVIWRKHEKEDDKEGVDRNR